MNTPKWTIYCHQHIESGRRYIGLTSQTMEKRWKNHIHVSKNSKNGRWHFPNAIRKYGPEAFSHEVLEVCYSLEVANLAEECWIEFYDTRNSEKGFNLARGGLHVPHPVRKNPWNNPEYRAARTEESRVRAADPMFIAAQTSGSRERAKDPKFRAGISKGLEKKWEDESFRKARTEESQTRWKDRQYREKILLTVRSLAQDPEWRSKCAHGNYFNSKKTHCIHGHEFSLENTRYNNGQRVCRICSRNNLRESRRNRALLCGSDK